mgnify:CR=1 FL=1
MTETEKIKKCYDICEEIGESEGVGIHIIPLGATGISDDIYRVYHKDGYCMTISRTEAGEEFDTRNQKDGFIYEFYGDEFEGFMPIEIDKALDFLSNLQGKEGLK